LVEMEVEATVMAAEAVVVMERVATGVVAKEVAWEVVAKAVAAKAVVVMERVAMGVAVRAVAREVEAREVAAKVAAKVAVMCPLKPAGMEVVEKAVAVA
jgi:hypothetical protein